ncbi:MAG: hypothetical protein ACLSGF_06365 [Alistipes onderdonkii]
MMSGRISVEPVKDPTISATVSTWATSTITLTARPKSIIHRRWAARRDRRDSGPRRDVTLELQADYSRKFGRHTLQATVGYSYNDYIHQSSEMYAYDFPIDGFGAWNIGSANSTLDGTSKLTSYKYRIKLIGFYGRVNYNFDNKYLLWPACAMREAISSERTTVGVLFRPWCRLAITQESSCGMHIGFPISNYGSDTA